MIILSRCALRNALGREGFLTDFLPSLLHSDPYLAHRLSSSCHNDLTGETLPVYFEQQGSRVRYVSKVQVQVSESRNVAGGERGLVLLYFPFSLPYRAESLNSHRIIHNTVLEFISRRPPSIESPRPATREQKVRAARCLSAPFHRP